MKVKGLGLERVLLKWVWSRKDVGKELLWRRVGNSSGTKTRPWANHMSHRASFSSVEWWYSSLIAKVYFFFSALICKWRRSALFPKGWVFLPKVSVPSRDLTSSSPGNSLPATTQLYRARWQSDWNHGAFILFSWPFFSLGENHGCRRSLRRLFRRPKAFQFQWLFIQCNAWAGPMFLHM